MATAAAATYTPTLETIAPNAFQMKRSYNTFLARGLAVAAVVHLVGLGAYWLIVGAQEELAAQEDMQMVNYADLAPPPSLEEAPPPPDAPPPVAAPAAVPTGTPTPVPEEEAEQETIETQEEMAAPGPSPGTGIGVIEGTGTVPVAPPPPPPPPPPAPPPPPPPPAEPPPPEIFEVVEQQPVLIGGLEALQASIDYPELARRAGVEGRVVVQFVVNEDGTPTDVRVVRGVGSGLDDAAVRAVQRARFQPGMQRGRAVKVRFTLPITFRLS